jgi:hypothetical protein
MKSFKELEEAYGRSDAYSRDYQSSVSGMGKRQSAAYRADGGGNDERHDLDVHHSVDHPHSVHINGKKWKTFGSQSHASNVAKKIKGATVHKEEVELEQTINELSSDTLQNYKDKAKKSADELTAKGKHGKSADRWLNVMKATGKQIDKTTAGIKKALNKEETLSESKHKVSVTVSEKDHPMVSKRSEKQQKRVVVSADSKDEAVARAKKFYTKQGYHVHDAEYHSAMTVKEELDEAKDPGEYDYEGQMARTQLQTTLRNCEDLIDMIKDDENMPEWVQSKITLAQDYITTVRDYLQSKEELGEAFKLNQDAKLTAIAKVRKEKMKSFRQHIGKK